MEKVKINLKELKAFIDQIEQTQDYENEEIDEYYDRIFSSEGGSCMQMKMMQIKAWYQDEMKRRGY